MAKTTKDKKATNPRMTTPVDPIQAGKEMIQAEREKQATGSVVGSDFEQVKQVAQEQQDIVRQQQDELLKSQEFIDYAKSQGAKVAGGQVVAGGGTGDIVEAFLGQPRAVKTVPGDLGDMTTAQRGELIGKQQIDINKPVTRGTEVPQISDVRETDIGKTIKNDVPEIGGVSTADNEAFIKAVEDLRKIREEDAKKEQQRADRGIATGESSTQQMQQFSTAQQAFGVGAASNVFGAQDIAAQQQELLTMNNANSLFDTSETARRNQLIRSLNDTTIGQAADKVQLAKLTTAQLEQLSGSEGIELSASIKERLQAEGKSLIEQQKIARNQNQAELDYQKSQLNREFGRTIDDREEFNAQQDAKLRRLAASFGGGKIASLSANIAVMKQAEKGQRVLEDLRGQFTDRSGLLSTKSMSVIDTYTNNVGLIESQMSAKLEDKLASITNTIDSLIEAGVTNREELNTAVAQAKIDYNKSYSTIAEKALTMMQKEEQRLFDNKLKLAQFEETRKKQQSSVRFTNRFGQPSSAETSNTLNMQNIGEGPNSDNCVLYCRDKVTNLPFGLWTKEDKQRAVAQAGSNDMSKIKVGDAILTAEGDWGHAAVVKEIRGDELILDEANYDAGNITQGRSINRNDMNIYGFIPSTGQISGAIGPNVNREGTNPAIQSQLDTTISVYNVTDAEIDQAVFEFENASANTRSEIINQAREAGVLDQFIAKVNRKKGISVSQAQQDAQNILSGVIDVGDLSTERKDNVSGELAREKDRLLKRGDILGTIRASAINDKDPTEGTIKSMEKAFLTLDQIGTLSESLITGKTFEDFKADKSILSKTKQLIEGTVASINPFDTKSRQIQGQLISITPNLARGVFGEVGVLTDNDIKLYQQTLPNLRQTDEVKRAMAALTLRTVRNALDRKIEINAGLGRDISGIEGVYTSVTNKINEIEQDLGINEQAQPQSIETVIVINPDNGERITIDKSRLNDAIKAGAKLAE